MKKTFLSLLSLVIACQFLNGPSAYCDFPCDLSRTNPLPSLRLMGEDHTTYIGAVYVVQKAAQAQKGDIFLAIEGPLENQAFEILEDGSVQINNGSGNPHLLGIEAQDSRSFSKLLTPLKLYEFNLSNPSLMASFGAQAYSQAFLESFANDFSRSSILVDAIRRAKAAPSPELSQESTAFINSLTPLANESDPRMKEDLEKPLGTSRLDLKTAAELGLFVAKHLADQFISGERRSPMQPKNEFFELIKSLPLDFDSKTHSEDTEKRKAVVLREFLVSWRNRDMSANVMKAYCTAALANKPLVVIVGQAHLSEIEDLIRTNSKGQIEVLTGPTIPKNIEMLEIMMENPSDINRYLETPSFCAHTPQQMKSEQYSELSSASSPRTHSSKMNYSHRNESDMDKWELPSRGWRWSGESHPVRTPRGGGSWDLYFEKEETPPSRLPLH